MLRLGKEESYCCLVERSFHFLLRLSRRFSGQGDEDISWLKG